MNTTKTNPYCFKPGVGSVSHGTMRAQDLIPAFLDTLEDIDKDRHNAIKAKPENREVISWIYSNDDESEQDEPEDACEFVDELMNELNNYAPTGLYFGAHPGDGSDYGFWPSESLTEDFDGFKSVKSLSDAAKLGIETDPEDSTYPPLAYRGEWLHVNDHGNCTLYVRDDSGDHEVWSCV